MAHQFSVATALAACALACSAAPAFAATYDFSSVPQDTTVTPYTLNGATFDSPDSGSGAFTFGANGGLYSQLGPNVLSSGGNSADLSISFATAQTGISFDYANLDEYLYNKTTNTYQGNGTDSLTITTNAGYSAQINLNPPATGNGSFAFPQGLFNLSGTPAFTSITITANDSQGEEGLAISTLTSTPVPLPAAVWLFAAGVGGIAGFGRRHRVAA